MGDATGRLVSERSARTLPPEVSDALQSADILAQHLAGLAEVLARLADGLPSGSEPDAGDALDRLTLAGLQRRLSGLPEPEREADIELF